MWFDLNSQVSSIGSYLIKLALVAAATVTYGSVRRHSAMLEVQSLQQNIRSNSMVIYSVRSRKLLVSYAMYEWMDHKLNPWMYARWPVRRLRWPISTAMPRMRAWFDHFGSCICAPCVCVCVSIQRVREKRQKEWTRLSWCNCMSIAVIVGGHRHVFVLTMHRCSLGARTSNTEHIHTFTIISKYVMYISNSTSNSIEWFCRDAVAFVRFALKNTSSSPGTRSPTENCSYSSARR